MLNDSVVVIPKTIAKWMLEDIEKAKSYEQEIKVLYGVIDKKQDIIVKQDTIMDVLRAKNASLNKTLLDCDEVTGLQANEIGGLKKDVRRQTRLKRFWTVAAFTAAAGILGNHLHWKYVKP